MLLKVVAVALPSLSKTCIFCSQKLLGSVVFCDHCKKTQPTPQETPSYFDIFGLEPELEINLDELRKRFYRLSQLTHPDTQVLRPLEEQRHASLWSTLINRAYLTLKNEKDRIDYLLTLLGSPSSGKNSPASLELAESYFELQEQLLEGNAEPAIQKFYARLEDEQKRAGEALKKLSLDWRQQTDKSALLSQLKTLSDTQKYLASLRADLEKRKGLL